MVVLDDHRLTGRAAVPPEQTAERPAVTVGRITVHIARVCVAGATLPLPPPVVTVACVTATPVTTHSSRVRIAHTLELPERRKAPSPLAARTPRA